LNVVLYHPINHCLEKRRFSTIKIAPGISTTEVKLRNFYLSPVGTKVTVIVINYITM